MAILGVPLWLAIRLLASGDMVQNPGPKKKQQLTGLGWHAVSTRHLFAGPMIQTSLFPGYLWFNPVVVADLLQPWTDGQGAAGGGAKSRLN